MPAERRPGCPAGPAWCHAGPVRAVVIEKFGSPPTLREVADPAPSDAGVVVAVEATGLCRSDWHGWAGHDPDITLPHVPGHELAGTVVAVGPAVRGWAQGARVTVPFVCGCGRCTWCRSGQAQVCPAQTQPGFTHWGSFAELVALHDADANLVGLPDGLSAEDAASLGCRFATSYRALVGRARVQPGETVCVVGCGGVGLSAVMIAAALGARVVAVDVSGPALRLARELGADALVDATGTGDVPAAVTELTGGGADVAVDAVGSAGTCADAILSLRRRGRHVQVGLLPAALGRTPLPMDRVIGYELDLLGSHGMAAADYPALIAMVADGQLAPGRLVTRRIGLLQAVEALPSMGSAPWTGVTVIDPRRAGRPG
jgi:alcohol dehydrogenase